MKNTKQEHRLDSLKCALNLYGGHYSNIKNSLSKHNNQHQNHAYYEVPLLRKLLDYAPNRVARVFPQLYPIEMLEQQENLEESLMGIEFIGLDSGFMYEWSSFWAEAHKLADIEGNAYVVIGTESPDFAEELQVDEKITWLAILPKTRVTRNYTKEIYSITITGHDQIEKFEDNLTFHRTRIIKLAGIRKLDINHAEENDISVIQNWVQPYLVIEEAHCNVNEMVKQHSFFVLARRGLNNGIRARFGQQAIADWLDGLMAGIKNLGGLIIDRENEEANVVTRSYSGIDKLIDANINWFVAQTGFPKSFIIGEQSGNGLSTAASSDLRKLADIVLEYQSTKHKPAISCIIKHQAQSIGLPVPHIQFKSSYTPTALEQAEIDLKIAEARLKQIEVEQAESNTKV